ncbi:MAG: SDR family NAD(P)-dependent oxidoreductase [Burkholderiaceae bacterium]
MNTIDLQGRVAVVTGGASGIGAAITQRVAESGARVVIWDRQLEPARQQASALPAVAAGSHLAIEVDVTDHASVQAAVAATCADASRIDILCCSAGITGPNATSWEYPVDAWKQVIDVNLHGLYLCCREVTPVMLEQDYGRIVNIASVAGLEGNPNAPAYSASKAAVIALTKSLGKETASSGVRVNCVTPAVVRTPLFAQMTQQHIDYMLSKIPMGRFGEVEEVAAMVAWLASEECSFSTGAAFDLTGGRATY